MLQKTGEKLMEMYADQKTVSRSSGRKLKKRVSARLLLPLVSRALLPNDIFEIYLNYTFSASISVLLGQDGQE